MERKISQILAWVSNIIFPYRNDNEARIDLLATILPLIYSGSSFLLDVVYSATASYDCDRNGNSNTFSDLDKAKASCSADADCMAVYDSCGHGTEFRHCSAPLSFDYSRCGSILYHPGGKLNISLYFYI